MCLPDGDQAWATCLTELLSLGRFHSWDVTCFQTPIQFLKESSPWLLSPPGSNHALLTRAEHSVSLSNNNELWKDFITRCARYRIFGKQRSAIFSGIMALFQGHLSKQCVWEQFVPCGPHHQLSCCQHMLPFPSHYPSRHFSFKPFGTTDFWNLPPRRCLAHQIQ